MSSMQEWQSSYRELSSELFEPPVIKPALLHMCAPRPNEEALDYQLQVNREALWKWRNIRSPSQLFDVGQDELVKMGIGGRHLHARGLG